jgi:hypothetical protein
MAQEVHTEQKQREKPEEIYTTRPKPKTKNTTQTPLRATRPTTTPEHKNNTKATLNLL